MSTIEPVIARCVAPGCPENAHVEAPGEQARLCPRHGQAFIGAFPEGSFPNLLEFQDQLGLKQMREEARSKALAKAARARSDDPLESQLMAQVERWLSKQTDLKWWRQMVGQFQRNGQDIHIGELGEPDLLVEVYVKRPRGAGHVIAPLSCRIELKTKDGVVSKAQKRWHERATARGGLVRVCRSVAEVEAFVNEVRRLEGLKQLS